MNPGGSPGAATPIQVVGIGLEGAAGLPEALRRRVLGAAVLAGSDRQLSYFPDYPGERWPWRGLDALATQILQWLETRSPQGELVILASGDPLFYGLGRWLLEICPADALTFHPHPSAIQLAFSRLRIPWQGAEVVSLHGRSAEALITALRRGADPIAIFTDGVHTPGAIARLLQDMALPRPYDLWVCENLGGPQERVAQWPLDTASRQEFAPLNVVVLRGAESPAPVNPPLLGIADGDFLTFGDRPGLITKREVRLLALGELALEPGLTVWDVGAGTGSISVEVARLMGSGAVYAVEKTAVGATLISQNAARFHTPQVQPVLGSAPAALGELPNPDRVFIGGSGGDLAAILEHCGQRLRPGGRMVTAIATLEHSATLQTWLSHHPQWQSHACLVNLSRSIAIGPLTRWHPLNPVTLTTLWRPEDTAGAS